MLEPSNAGQVALRGQLDDAGLNSPGGLLRVTRDVTRRFAWTKDTRNPGNHFIRQTIAEETTPMPGKIIFVVDGSGNMQPHWKAVIESLEKIPATTKQTVLVASDQVDMLAGPTELKALKPIGGQDNLPALLQAWNLAVQETGSAIVWIHGPQPIRLESEQALRQAIERTATRPAIYEIQTEAGPDQIVTQLDGIRSLHCTLRTGDLSADLARVIGLLHGTVKSWTLRRAQVDSQAEAEADGAIEGSLHLARLWANDAVVRLQAEHRSDEAAKQASVYQLVTPVSGAVVLETHQQYAQTGLAPVDTQTVPAIPEPSTWALMALGLAAAWLVRRRRLVVRSSP